MAEKVTVEIEFGIGKWKTRGGDLATVFSDRGVKSYPLLGVGHLQGNDVAVSWNVDGLQMNGEVRDLDLMEAVE